MAELSWHVEAIEDLHDVGEFIGRRSPEFAPQFVARISAAADRLIDMPRLGRIVPEIADGAYRELIFQNYRIVYRILDSTVIVVGVIPAAMDMDSQVERRGWNVT